MHLFQNYDSCIIQLKHRSFCKIVKAVGTSHNVYWQHTQYFKMGNQNMLLVYCFLLIDVEGNDSMKLSSFLSLSFIHNKFSKQILCSHSNFLEGNFFCPLMETLCNHKNLFLIYFFKMYIHFNFDQDCEFLNKHQDFLNSQIPTTQNFKSLVASIMIINLL